MVHLCLCVKLIMKSQQSVLVVVIWPRYFAIYIGLVIARVLGANPVQRLFETRDVPTRRQCNAILDYLVPLHLQAIGRAYLGRKHGVGRFCVHISFVET